MTTTTQSRRAAARFEAVASAATAAVDRMLAADATGDADALKTAMTAALAALAALAEQCTASTDRAVAIARQLDMSWQDIGDALGISRQGAYSRFKGTAARDSHGTIRNPRPPRQKAGKQS